MAGPTYKKALVTGAARGMGRAIAQALKEQGLELILIDREGPELASLVGELGQCAEGHKLDLRDQEALAALVAGHEIDVLVNNAGVLPELGPAQEMAADSIDTLIDINLRAPLYLTRLVLPGMIGRGRGHLFFLGSVAGSYPYPSTAFYSATKGGIHAFVNSLRLDLVGSGVRSTVLAPGRVETRIYDDIFGGPEGAKQALYEGVASIQPADMAALLVAALTMPQHIDVTFMEIMPTDGAIGGTKMSKSDGSAAVPASEQPREPL